MRLVVTTLLKLAWGSFLLATSLYCLLASLPATYHAYIYAPTSSWMLWFVEYHVILYWVAVICAAVGFLPEEITPAYVVLIAGQAAAGIYFLFRPLTTGFRSDRSALLWALAALVPIVLMGLWELGGQLAAMRRENLRDFQYRYTPLTYAAVIIAVVYFLAGKIALFAAHRTFTVPDSELVIVVWSAISLLLIGVLAISALNFIGIIAARMPRPRAARIVLLALTSAVILHFTLTRFFAGVLGFEGRAAQIYCATFAATLTLFALTRILPLLAAQRDIAGESTIMYVNRPLHLSTYIFAALLCAAALALPAWLNGRDWYGIIGHGFALLFWILFTTCVYSVRRKRANFSLPMLIGIVLVAVAAIKALQLTETFWGRPMGKTSDEISRAMDAYGTQDASFDLTNRLLRRL